MKKYLFLLFLSFSIAQAQNGQSMDDSLLINDLFDLFQKNNLLRSVDTTGWFMGGPPYNEIILQGYNAADRSQNCKLSIQKTIRKESELAKVRVQISCAIPLREDPAWCREVQYNDWRCAISTRSDALSFGKVGISTLITNESNQVELLQNEKETLPHLIFFSTEKEKKTYLRLEKTNEVLVATYRNQPSKDTSSSSLFKKPYSNFVFAIPN